MICLLLVSNSSRGMRLYIVKTFLSEKRSVAKDSKDSFHFPTAKNHRAAADIDPRIFVHRPRNATPHHIMSRVLSSYPPPVPTRTTVR